MLTPTDMLPYGSGVVSVERVKVNVWPLLDIDEGVILIPFRPLMYTIVELLNPDPFIVIFVVPLNGIVVVDNEYIVGV